MENRSTIPETIGDENKRLIYQERLSYIKSWATKDNQVTFKPRVFGRGCVFFKGTINTDRAETLSPLDLTLLVSHSTLPLGGFCKISGRNFHGYYNTK